MNKAIQPNEIKFNPTSYVDPNARVFEWQGEIYRAISLEKKDFYQSLLKDEVFINLQRKNWVVQSNFTDYSLDGYAFVVKHRRIPFISYCVEWPALMLKDAALLTLDICQELAKHNLSLQDAYPWNIYFDLNHPTFIDVGSIVSAPEDLVWTPYQQFCQFFLYPLYLSSAGLSQAARLQLFDYLQGVSEINLVKLLPFFYKIRHPKIFSRVIFPYWLEKLFPNAPEKMQKKLEFITKEISKRDYFSKLRAKFFKELRNETQNIKIPIFKSNWYKYYGSDFSDSLESSSGWNPKQKVIADILDRLKPKTVLDIACNRGWYAMLAAVKGAAVVAFEKDEHCVNQLYLDAKKKNLRILPLVMDVLNPTPAFGWNAKQFPSALKRLSCEMVLVLALVHHLVFRQWQNFDRIVETLSDFTKEWLLVEFPLPEDEKVRGMWTDRCAWYNLNNFISSLKVKFEVKEVIDSYPLTRKLLLCKKK